jgi:hypothetical protein
MEFSPREVARNVFECHEQMVRSKAAGNVTVCLRVRKSTRDRLREGEAWWVSLYVKCLSTDGQLCSKCPAF